MTRAPFDLDHFAYRVIRDAMAEATPAYWRRRAATFAEAAKPRPYVGRSTPEEREARRAALQAKSDACLMRAQVCELTPDEERLILDIIGDIYTGTRSVIRTAADIQLSAAAASDPRVEVTRLRVELEQARAMIRHLVGTLHNGAAA